MASPSGTCGDSARPSPSTAVTHWWSPRAHNGQAGVLGYLHGPLSWPNGHRVRATAINRTQVGRCSHDVRVALGDLGQPPVNVSAAQRGAGSRLVGYHERAMSGGRVAAPNISQREEDAAWPTTPSPVPPSATPSAWRERAARERQCLPDRMPATSVRTCDRAPRIPPGNGASWRFWWAELILSTRVRRRNSPTETFHDDGTSRRAQGGQRLMTRARYLAPLMALGLVLAACTSASPSASA